MLFAEVSKGGANLSSGERQLLCFARALLETSARVLILDEATSNLDEQSDAAAWEQVEPGRFMPRRVRGSCHGRALG